MAQHASNAHMGAIINGPDGHHRRPSCIRPAYLTSMLVAERSSVRLDFTLRNVTPQMRKASVGASHCGRLANLLGEIRMPTNEKYTRYIEPTSPRCDLSYSNARATIPYHDRRLTSREAAAYLGVAPSTLSKMRSDGRSPAYWKAASKHGAVAYSESVLADYMRVMEGRVPGSCSKRPDARQAQFAFVVPERNIPCSAAGRTH